MVTCTLRQLASGAALILGLGAVALAASGEVRGLDAVGVQGADGVSVPAGVDPFAVPRTVDAVMQSAEQSAAPRGPALTVDTPHLTMTAAISGETVTPGEHLTMVFDITPRPGMHVYAPGEHEYQVIGVEMRSQPWQSLDPLTYPESETYHFAPLDERVEVYMKAFRLSRGVSVLETPEARKLLAGLTELTFAGALVYQACDDKLCYAPREVPFQWTLPLSPSGEPHGGR